MFQEGFLWTTANSRTNTAILFFALAMMVLFNDKIDPLKRRILFIVFIASCMVSHYSTTYIFFFIMLGTFIGVEILSRKYTFKKVVSLTIVILFFALIFFWYSQVTEKAFNAGVGFIEDTLTNLNRFLIEESRGGDIQLMLGGGITQKGITYKIHFVFTWLTFALIGIGIITLIRRYKEMSFPELNFKKPDFLNDKFEVGYFVIALVCSGLLVAMVVLPFISEGYGIDRLYAVAITILSVFFVIGIGGIIISKHFFFFTKRKPVLKEKQKSWIKNISFKKKTLPKKEKEGENALQNSLRKSVEEEKGSEVRAYLIILLVLIPYFLFGNSVIYNIGGVPRSIILNSEGEQYDMLYVHDEESYGAKWLKSYANEKAKIYTDAYGGIRLRSQGGIRSNFAKLLIEDKIAIKDGYIYLRYYNVVDDKLLGSMPYNMTEYTDIFGEMSKVYANGGSEVWKK
jgi:uncharacterized membrane protein